MDLWAVVIVNLQIFILFTLYRFNADAIRGRSEILAAESRLQIENRDFELRTVARWNALADRNPNLIVPRVEEPLKGPTLTPAQLERASKP